MAAELHQSFEKGTNAINENDNIKQKKKKKRKSLLDGLKIIKMKMEVGFQNTQALGSQ